MTGGEAGAIARLEVHVEQLVASNARLSAKVDAIEQKLDQSAGGMAVLRWLGLGSLGSAIAVSAGVWAWFKGI
jgi:hypothetical protein